MEHPVPQFARSFATIAAVLATMAIAPLTMIGPALAGPHDGSGLQCGPGRSSLYPGFRIGAGFGYTDDVTAGAPAGFIGGDFGYHREVWKPGLSVGAVIGWYGLGDATVQGSGGETVQVDYSLIPAFGLVTYDAMNYRDVLFQLSGGAGAYNPEPIAELHSQFGEALATSLAAAGRVDGPDLQPVSAPTSTPARAPACRAASAGQPLRVGYLSSDFINHSVAFFMGGLLQHHDRSRFEVCCYHNRGWGDSMTEQLRALGHHWVECEHLSDEALVQRIRADGIDILVDLSGHTAGGRLRVFGLGAAPMQVGYLGYPTATGVRGLHHRMSDAVIDPGDMPGTGSETPLRLPVSMFCYRPPESPPIEALAPSQRGPITFGSFNNLAKLSDRTLDLWAQVLRAVPASRLLLKAGAAADPANRQDIEAYLATRGVTADRLDLRARVEARTGHLSLYNQVDVALDTYPFNGATTTCEALWMGVPVVTLKGRTHTSRMGASILGAAGRSGWVTGSEEAFVDVASRLARDTAALSLWRHNARAALQRSRLLDERAFAADFEQALLQAWAGAPPLA